MLEDKSLPSSRQFVSVRARWSNWGVEPASTVNGDITGIFHLCPLLLVAFVTSHTLHYVAILSRIILETVRDTTRKAAPTLNETAQEKSANSTRQARR